MTNLFSELTIKGHKIKNRIVMPPMVCFGWAKNDGIVTEEHVQHYEARAKGGVGVIVIEATCVNANGRLTDSQLGIWSDVQIDGLRRIAAACHKHGAVVLAQIHHAGLKTAKNVTQEPVSASNHSEKDINARALTIDEIHNLQEDYANAAVRAEKAGFDGVELHGAHGYLISQFMSPLTNKREDAYGGDLGNRVRFAAEIITKIKDRVGSDFIVGYRMGGNEPNLENGIAIAKELEKRGLDLLHVSAGISSGELPAIPEGFNYNWIVYIGTEIKKHVSIPVIVVNGVRKPEGAAYLVENGQADFVAVGKGLLVDPEWANKAQSNSSVIECLSCGRCFWFTSGKLCPRNKTVAV